MVHFAVAWSERLVRALVGFREGTVDRERQLVTAIVDKGAADVVVGLALRSSTSLVSLAVGRHGSDHASSL